MAQGKRLALTQQSIRREGHVMQFRINAENPRENFTPSPGKLEYYIPSGGPHVRVDSACYPGYTIPPHYDSMIAKLIVKGVDREDVIKKSLRALKEFHIGGVFTTIPFHQYMLAHEPFLQGKYPITYIDSLIEQGCRFEG